MRFVTSSRIHRKFPAYVYNLFMRDQKFNEVIAQLFCRDKDYYVPAPADIKDMTPEYVISCITGYRVKKGDTSNPYEPLVHTCTGYKKSDLAENPYYKNVKLSECDYGDFKIVKVTDMPYELVQDSVPVIMNVDGYDCVVPRIGYWMEKPEPYYVLQDRNDTTWMSITFSEIRSMQSSIDEAKGRVLVLGCGLGYYAYMVALKPDVERVTIIENNESVIKLFREVILPQFGDVKDKISVVCSDAYEYMESVQKNTYDLCFADIWSSIRDSYSYFKLKKQCGNNYRGMDMHYWIEEAFIGQVFNNIRTLLLADFVKQEKLSNMYEFYHYVEDKLKHGGDNYLKVASNMLKFEVIRNMDDIDRFWKYDNVRKMYLEQYDRFIEGISDVPYSGF